MSTHKYILYRNVKQEPTLSVDEGVSKDKLYTIIMTDPDAKDRAKHEYREWVHWVMINVSAVENKNDKDKNGKYLFDTLTDKESKTLIAFKPSGPPKKTKLHRYVLLVYEQSKG